MTEIYTKEPEKLEASGPDSLQKPESEKNRPLEFRAEIIPYDTCENSNSPLLAFSGDNINIIFNIPKDNFLKLAVAAIGRLDHDSDCKPPENSASASDSQSDSHKKHSETSISNLNVEDFETDNTNNMNTYENGFECDSAENKGVISQTDPKSHEVSNPLSKSEKTNAYRNGSMELNGESLSNDCETKKPNENSEMESCIESYDLQSTSTVAKQVVDSIQSLSRNEDCAEKSNSGVDESGSKNDHVQYKNTLEKVGETECENYNASGNDEMKEPDDENKFSKLEQHADYKQNPESCATENSDHDELNLSAHSLDISSEDCPNLESAWPAIHPFTKTEEISIEELKSFELNGVLTKYYKLDFLNELIVIRVTNNILIDAAIYRLNRKSERNSMDSSALSCKSKESLEGKQSAESLKDLKETSEINVGSMQEDYTETERISYEQNKDKELACTSKTSEERNFAERNPIPQAEFSKRLDFQIESKDIVSTNLSTQNKPSNFINETSEAESIKESLVCDLEGDISQANTSLDIKESKSVDEKTEHEMPDKDIGNTEIKEMIAIKIAENLDDLDINFPGSSPTERLMLSLHDSLKNTTIEPEAKKKAAELITNFSVNLNELRDKRKSLDYSESEFKGREHLNEVNDQDQNVTELSDKCCDSNDKGSKLPGKSISDFPDIVTSAQPDVLEEIKPQFKIESIEDFSSSEDKSIESITVDESAVEKPVLNDCNFQGEISLSNVNVSLEETNTEKKESPLSVGDKFSQKIAFGNDLDSKNKILIKSCKQSYIKESNESDPFEEMANAVCECKDDIVRNICKTPDKDEICSSEKMNITKESYEEVNIKENISLEETRIKSPKLEMSACLEENAIHDEKLNIVDTNDNSVKKTIEDNLKIHKSACDSVLSENVAEETSGRNECIECEETDANLVERISQASQSSTAEESPEKCEPNAPFKSELIKEMNDDNEVENESISDELVKEETTQENLEATDSTECKSFKETLSENKSFIEQNSEFTDYLILEKTSNIYISNGNSLMDTTAEADAESISEGGDLESDDVKSVASESDDSKDSEKKTSVRKENSKKNRREADEVDCAPTRVRTKKATSLLSEDVIPENSEVKNAKSSKARGSTLAVTSKPSGRISPVGRSLRSKSLDPNPPQSKTQYDKKHDNIVESEVNRKTRAKTPDIISKKDIKITVRSSPRKLARSSAIPEPSSASKVQSTKPSVADSHSKSRANLDSSISTSKRSKRGGKD